MEEEQGEGCKEILGERQLPASSQQQETDCPTNVNAFDFINDKY